MPDNLDSEKLIAIFKLLTGALLPEHFDSPLVGSVGGCPLPHAEVRSPASRLE